MAWLGVPEETHAVRGELHLMHATAVELEPQHRAPSNAPAARASAPIAAPQPSVPSPMRNTRGSLAARNPQLLSFAALANGLAQLHTAGRAGARSHHENGYRSLRTLLLTLLSPLTRQVPRIGIGKVYRQGISMIPKQRKHVSH